MKFSLVVVDVGTVSMPPGSELKLTATLLVPPLLPLLTSIENPDHELKSEEARRSRPGNEIVSSEAFGRYVAEIWSDLRKEASRGMRDDEDRALHSGEHGA